MVTTSSGNNFAYNNPAFDKDPEMGDQGKIRFFLVTTCIKMNIKNS